MGLQHIARASCHSQGAKFHWSQSLSASNFSHAATRTCRPNIFHLIPGQIGNGCFVESRRSPIGCVAHYFCVTQLFRPPAWHQPGTDHTVDRGRHDAAAIIEIMGPSRKGHAGCCHVSSGQKDARAPARYLHARQRTPILCRANLWSYKD